MQSTEHIGVRKNTTETELAARRPAEITQVSLPRFFPRSLRNSNMAKTKQPQELCFRKTNRSKHRRRILTRIKLSWSTSPQPFVSMSYFKWKQKQVQTSDMKEHWPSWALREVMLITVFVVCVWLRGLGRTTSVSAHFSFLMIRKPSILMAFLLPLLTRHLSIQDPPK